MLVAISDYEPHVRCDKTLRKGPPWDSCLHIFADMKATKDLQVFGSGSDPRVDVRLPWAFNASTFTLTASVSLPAMAVTSLC